MAQKIGRQTPTRFRVLPYSKTYGMEAIELYKFDEGRNSVGRQTYEKCSVFQIESHFAIRYNQVVAEA